jgi:tuberculosinol/isotuberculosinol synthase
MTIVNQNTFLELPVAKIAEFVRNTGPQVCVLAVNGTRRWFMMEHEESQQNAEQAYLNTAGKRFVELCKMCFDHGLDTVLSPIFSAGHSTRHGEYMRKIGAEGLALVATHPDYLAFYKEYRVRVRFYGDYRKQLASPALAHLCDAFDEVTRVTASNNRYRLFFGVFANDATESIAELSVRHFQETGQIPTREKLVELYYGEYVEPASLFIGFSKLRVYDYPLLNLGRENLYFTIAPSLYLSELQLRNILYDHICLRRIEREDYNEMTEQNFRLMQNFYRANRETTLGIGTQHDGIWFPNTQFPSQSHALKLNHPAKKPIGRASPGDNLSHVDPL